MLLCNYRKTEAAWRALFLKVVISSSAKKRNQSDSGRWRTREALNKWTVPPVWTPVHTGVSPSLKSLGKVFHCLLPPVLPVGFSILTVHCKTLCACTVHIASKSLVDSQILMWVGMLQYCLASSLILLSALAFVQLLFLVLMQWFGWCEVWFLHLLWLASGTWMHLQTAWSSCPPHVQGRRVWACCSCYTWLITTSQINASLSWLDTQTYGSCIWQTTTCRLSLQGKSVRLLGKTMLPRRKLPPPHDCTSQSQSEVLSLLLDDKSLTFLHTKWGEAC